MTILQWIFIILLFFILIPLVAFCFITAIKLIFEKIIRKKTFKITLLIGTVAICFVGIAVVPPVTYLIAESGSYGYINTGEIAKLSFREDTDIRYIEFKGREYQELDTSLSEKGYEENFDYSEDAHLTYGGALANVISDNRTLIEKYIFMFFNMPIHSQILYSVGNEGMEGYVSLEGASLFVETEIIDERIDFYRDFSNYDYFVQDYNKNKSVDIKIDYDAVKELRDLTFGKSLEQAEKLKVAADYDMFTVLGESKNNLILREIGEIYMDSASKKMYAIRSETWNNDGAVTLRAFPISRETSDKLIVSFTEAGIL